MRELLRRLHYVLTQRRRDTELIEEMAFHAEMSGRRAFGNITLAREEHTIVSPVPGTTRDAVDVLLEKDNQRFCLVDTAGLQAIKRPDGPVEFFGQRSGAEIGSRVAINDHVAELLTGELASSIVRVAMAGFYAALMYIYSPALCRIALAIAASNILVLRYCSARRAASA